MRPSDRAGLVAELFDTAIDQDTAERAAFLHQHCGADPDIRAEVESLVRAAKSAPGFMESGPAAPRQEHGVFTSGAVIGEYEIVSLIGKGGMGEVYLANDRRVTRQVALKLVRGGLDRETLTRRFQREQQLLAALNHPNIGQLFETGVTSEGSPFFAMEYVAGTRLDQFVRREKIDLPAKLALFRKICSAIAYAHQHLVIHRDIKPANILVTGEGEPKLLDFGIAKLLDEMAEDEAEQTLTIQRMLTPEYASPEQVRGERITTTSDIYSLGVLLYELLTEAKPYRLTSRRPEEISRAITGQEPVPPSENPDSKIENRKCLRGDLDNIALMALRKEPERRYASANALSQDIRRYLEGLPVHARKDTFGYRATKFVKRNRAGVVVASVAAAAVVGAFCLTLAEKRKADRRFNDVRQIANSLLFEVEGELQQGPTKAREKLVSHAVTYLDRLAAEVRSDPALQVEVAAGYLKVGDIQGRPFYANTGDTAGALASYAKAVEMLQPLASGPGGNRAAIRYLSQAWQSISRVQRRTGKWGEALNSSRKAVGLAEALVQAEPMNDAYRSLLADDYIHLGTALYKTEYAHTSAELLEALGYYRKALAIHSELMRANLQNREYQTAAAADYFWVGAAFRRLGDLSGDRENYRLAAENFCAQVALNAALLRSDPSNNRYRRGWADAVMNVAAQDLSVESGVTPTSLREAFAVIESIALADPANVEARRDLALAQHTLADFIASAGDVSGALELARKAFAGLETLLRHEPNNGDTVLTAIRCCHQIASFEKTLGQQQSILGTYETALRIANDWSRTKPRDIPASRLTAITLFHMGELEEAGANWSAAKELYARSQELWRQIPDDVLSPDDRATKNEVTDRLLRCESALSAR